MPFFPYPANQISLSERVVNEMAEAFEELPSDKAFREAMEDAAWKAAQEAKNNWETEARQHLKTTRDRYVRALYIYENFGEGVVIGLDTSQDRLIDAIENGAPPFNMKPGLLAAKRSRVIPVGENPTNFRTVSTAMREDEFMHPGWVGLDLTTEIEEELFGKILPKYLDEAFKAM